MEDRRVLFCGNALPLKMVEQLNLSVAGKKYEISLLTELNKQLGETLDIISLANVYNINHNGSKNHYLFKNKTFKHIRSVRIPIIRDIILNFSLLIYLLKWSWINRNKELKIVLLNSSLGNCLALIINRFFFNTKIFSLTIDTPFPNIKSNFSVYRFYLKYTFTLGHKLLQYFDGIIVLNKKAITALNLTIPYLVSRVGYSEDLVNNDAKLEPEEFSTVRKILFAGTLISYNGIEELIEGFVKTKRNDLELHIYGYGPLESYVKKSSSKSAGIFYHGAVNNATLIKCLENADLLINPRLTGSSVNDFGFPSKLIEYILSGTPVLTTDFDSLPDQLKTFLHIIENETSEGVRVGIEKVFSVDRKELHFKSFQAMKLVKEENNWKSIVYEMIKFIDSK